MVFEASLILMNFPSARGIKGLISIAHAGDHVESLKAIAQVN
jgi:hypothetical protein